MASSPSDSQVIRRRKGPAFEYLLPLIYAPVLPLIRIALRHKPVVRDRLFYGVLAGAFAHGTYLVSVQIYMMLRASDMANLTWRYLLRCRVLLHQSFLC
ncbi:uncharacterized protein LOC132068842 isoform X1 [Lycium ferocissimum]|uniref:uncharacterized protein LOC132068842 isoform X1 n=1 Tax=Lycium ferocissimum TaxID=112874 RepID=UPI0028165898|nr:uncharacterized protein LOC132068842 isoform X1 [Lycium ferocissimum]